MFFSYLGLFWWSNWLEIGSLWKYEHFELIISLYYSLNITIYAYQQMKRPLFIGMDLDGILTIYSILNDSWWVMGHLSWVTGTCNGFEVFKTSNLDLQLTHNMST